MAAAQAAQAGDLPKFTGFLHPNVTLREPPYLPFGGTYHGPDEFIGVLAEASAYLDVTGFEVISIVAGEDRVVLLMSFPLRRSGERVEITEHWTVTDGLVTEVQVFWFSVPVFGDNSVSS
jgi:ketosteroid isomerase-like protein